MVNIQRIAVQTLWSMRLFLPAVILLMNAGQTLAYLGLTLVEVTPQGSNFQYQYFPISGSCWSADLA